MLLFPRNEVGQGSADAQGEGQGKIERGHHPVYPVLATGLEANHYGSPWGRKAGYK